MGDQLGTKEVEEQQQKKDEEHEKEVQVGVAGKRVGWVTRDDNFDMLIFCRNETEGT